MGPDDWPPVAIVVPDDIRELDADVAAYHRELRGRRGLGRWTRFGVVRPMLVLVLVGLATAGSMMALLAPAAPRFAPPQPLAASARPVGAVGGLLPSTQVSVAGAATSTRSLRPALLFTVPARCDCQQLIRALLGQTEQYSLQLVLVSHDLPDSELAAARDAALGRARVALDPEGAIANAFGTDALVFVHADGLVDAIVRNPSAGARYELPLSQLSTGRPQRTARSSTA